MKAWSWKNGLEFRYKSGCGVVTCLLGFYIKKKKKDSGLFHSVGWGLCSFVVLGFLGFHWVFGVVEFGVCGVRFAWFGGSVGGFVRLLWCWFVGVLYSKKRKKIRGWFIHSAGWGLFVRCFEVVGCAGISLGVRLIDFLLRWGCCLGVGDLILLEFGRLFRLIDSVFVLLDVRLVMLIFHSSFHMLTVLTLLQFFLLSFLLSDLALFVGVCFA
jgi:hypothetical protein